MSKKTGEKRLLAERENKLKALIDAGIAPYPSLAQRTHTSIEFVKEFSDLKVSGQEVSVVGRVRAMRRLGKVIFMVLRDGYGSVQAFFQKDQLKNDYELLKNFEVGDFMEVSGVAFKTKTGEPTIKVVSFKLLSKALRPLPDKFHGLKEQETRFRNRELDLLMNDDVRDIFKKRALLLRHTRDFLDAEGFLEVETPVLQHLPGGAEANPFVTHHDALDIDLYLRIAPELFLKRLIIGGFEKVYELGKVFRNEGLSPQHLQEFTELEFYMAYANYDALIKLSENMTSAVLKKTFGTLEFNNGENELDFTPPWPRHEYYDLIREHADIDLEKILTTEDLLSAIKEKKHAVHLEKGMGYGKLIDNLFKATVRPKLIGPLHVVSHPIALSPLAKRDPEKAGRVERFQTIVVGHEIANAYSELNDPRDQRERFEKQAELREAGDREAHVKDDEFVEALEYGMPPTAGYGMGIDRLIAIVMNLPSVREAVFFPILRPAKDKK